MLSSSITIEEESTKRKTIPWLEIQRPHKGSKCWHNLIVEDKSPHIEEIPSH